MDDIKEEIKMLYKDAMYFHLIDNGFTKRRAKVESYKIIFGNKKNILFSQTLK